MVALTKYTDLITSEHSDKPKFKATVELACIAPVDLTNMLDSITAAYDIDTAVGAQLDVVGQWVGLTRFLDVPITDVYFTLDTGPGFNAGILRSEFDPLTGLSSLPDEYYRILLKAKILNNQWDGTIPSAYAIGETVFNLFGYFLFIQDNGNLTMNLGLVGPDAPPPLLIALFLSGKLDVKPATVRINEYIWQTVAGPIFMFNAPAASTKFGGFDVGHFATIIHP